MSELTHSTFRDKEKDMDTITVARPGMRSISRNRTHDKSTGTGRMLKRHGVFRTDVMNAFRAMARGVSGPAAWTRTLSFYRAARLPWAKQLG
jgi:hypothetical protein